MRRAEIDALEAEVSAHLDAGALSAAATAAVRGYGPHVLAYLHGILRDEDHARETFAHTLSELWSSLPRFQRRSALRTYFFQLAWHAALRRQRSPWRRRGQRLDTPALDALEAEVHERTARFLRTSARTRLADLRRDLEPAERALLGLRIDEGLGWDEIAAILSTDGEQVDAPTLRKRFERLKGRLKTLAHQDGAADET